MIAVAYQAIESECWTRSLGFGSVMTTAATSRVPVAIKRTTPGRYHTEEHAMPTTTEDRYTSNVSSTLGAGAFTRFSDVRHQAIPTPTGHYRLVDGSLLRVDVELGRWVGRLYTPAMEVKTQIRGSTANVHAWANAIAARHSPT